MHDGFCSHRQRECPDIAQLATGRAVYLIESGMSYDAYGAVRKGISQRFKLKPIGRQLWEDYHRPEMQLRPKLQRLFQLVSRV